MTIVYKLYQTYQTPVSSPASVPRTVTSGLHSSRASESFHSMYSLKTNLTDLESEAGSSVTETRTLGRQPRPPQPRVVMFDLAPEPLAPLSTLSARPLMMEAVQGVTEDSEELLDSAEKWNFPRTTETQTPGLDTKYLSL